MNQIPDIAPGPDHEDDEVLELLAGQPVLPARPGLAESFRSRLHAERSRRRFPVSPFLAAGIAAALLLVASAGWWHERQLRLDESAQLHGKLNTALQSLSAATRLQAISATVTEGSRGDEVEQALVTALLTDQSTNVRMAAAEALGRVARLEPLGQAVRRALAQENSPFVQLKILETTSRLSPEARNSAIAPILTREHIDPMVVSDARARLTEIVQGDSR